jgi:hypothetical protein
VVPGVIVPLRIVGVVVVPWLVVVSVVIRVCRVPVPVRIVGFVVVVPTRCMMVPGEGRRPGKCVRPVAMEILVLRGFPMLDPALGLVVLQVFVAHVLDGGRGIGSSRNQGCFRFLRCAMGCRFFAQCFVLTPGV